MGANEGAGESAHPAGTLEIRFHGRGGQGTVTLAALATDAAVRSGWHALGIPAFGPERTGAPVQAFLRLSRTAIRDRSEITHPHVVVIQDATLMESVDVTAGLRDGGLVLVNAAAASAVGLERGAWRLATLPVSEIAHRCLGSGHTSTAMLGFLARATGWLDRDAMVAAVEQRFAGSSGRRNRDAALEAFDAATTVPIETPSVARRDAPPTASPLLARLTPGLVAAPGSSAGNHTGGWRAEMPRFLAERCTGCDLCAVFCPEGVVFRVERHRYDFDPDYCKGCGICAAECPTDDIVMEAAR